VAGLAVVGQESASGRVGRASRVRPRDQGRMEAHEPIGFREDLNNENENAARVRNDLSMEASLLHETRRVDIRRLLAVVGVMSPFPLPPRWMLPSKQPSSSLILLPPRDVAPAGLSLPRFPQVFVCAVLY
jgi:hypothetical protein